MPDTDDDFLLAARLLAQEVRSPGNPFPPPAPYQSWSKDAVYETTVALYEKKGTALVAEARAVTKSDQGHLERRLLASIHNFLVDEAKATSVGLMRNRIATMLGHDAYFVRVTGAGIAIDGWAAAESAGATGLMWQGDRAELKAAANSIRAPLELKFNKQGPPPKATRKTMTDVIRAVFDAADGFYVPDQVLATVVHARFNEFLYPEKRDATDFRSNLEIVNELDGESEFGYLDVEAEDLAEYIWTDMSHDERKAYPMLGVDGGDLVRREAVMLAVCCGPREADAIVASIFDRVRSEELGEDALPVLEALSRRATGTSGRNRDEVDDEVVP